MMPLPADLGLSLFARDGLCGVVDDESGAPSIAAPLFFTVERGEIFPLLLKKGEPEVPSWLSLSAHFFFISPVLMDLLSTPAAGAVSSLGEAALSPVGLLAPCFLPILDSAGASAALSVRFRLKPRRPLFELLGEVGVSLVVLSRGDEALSPVGLLAPCFLSILLSAGAADVLPVLIRPKRLFNVPLLVLSSSSRVTN